MTASGLAHLVEQAHLEDPVGGEPIGAQEHLHGRRKGDLAGEAHRGSTPGEQSPLGFEDTEGGGVGGHPEVTAAQHFHPSGHAGAVDRGDDRLVQLDVPEDRLGAVIESVAVHLRDCPRPSSWRPRR